MTKGGAVVDASQQFLIESLPPILVLHLKRFYYDTKVFDVVKLRKQIDFGPELVIPSGQCMNYPTLDGIDSLHYVLPEIITPAQRSPHPVKYKLFSGTYIACIDLCSQLK